MTDYNSEDSFNDPVVRCAKCLVLIMRETITKAGQCPECGSKRVTEVRTLDSETEVPKLLEKGVDPDFIAQFQPPEEGVEDGVIK
jgi:DNA-directed RNA polymerase subunit RPC12/RpoP